MKDYLATIGTAIKLLLGLSVGRVGPWDEASKQILLSRSPLVVLALLSTSAVYRLAIGSFFAIRHDVNLSDSFVVPFFVTLAGLTMASLVVRRDEAMAAVAGVAAISLVTTIATIAFVIVGGVLGLPRWTMVAADVVIMLWFAFGIWRLTSVVTNTGVAPRARASAIAVTIVLIGAFWVYRPIIATLLPQRSETGQDAEADAMDAVFRSFEDVDMPAALIAQPQRIASAVAALPAHPAGAETLVLAVGGQGYQAIFDREARHAAKVLSAHGGGPALVMSNTARQAEQGVLAGPPTVKRMIEAIGKRARPGDTIILYLTSHGSRDATIEMAAPFLEFAALSAADVARWLDGAGLRRRIVIVSACYAGSWVDPLRNPTTIVMAAAAPDRTSFGCDDSRQYTLFGESVLAELARPVPLATAFAAAQKRIAAREVVERATPSLPRAWVGRDMKSVWTGGG